MNLYFVVEGRRTEMKIYAAWLSHVFPHKRKAPFHESYLKAVYRERGLSYTKKNPKPATEEHFLKALVERFDQTSHIRSFGRLIDDWRTLGAAI